MSNVPWSLENAPWSVQTPCDERWDTMVGRDGVGDDAVRHCARCDKDVYDLSAHSVTEAAALRASTARPCIRITQRLDGAIRVREGWWVTGRAAVLATALAACGTERAADVVLTEPVAGLSEAASASDIPELEAPPALMNIAETLQGEPAPVQEAVPPVQRALTGKPAVRHREPLKVEPVQPVHQVTQTLGGVPPMPD